MGLTIPVSVLYDQTVQSKRRKKNILVDQERMRKKLEENPSLKYNKNFNFMISPYDHKN